MHFSLMKFLGSQIQYIIILLFFSAQSHVTFHFNVFSIVTRSMFCLNFGSFHPFQIDFLYTVALASAHLSPFPMASFPTHVSPPPSLSSSLSFFRTSNSHFTSKLVLYHLHTSISLLVEARRCLSMYFHPTSLPPSQPTATISPLSLL